MRAVPSTLHRRAVPARECSGDAEDCQTLDDSHRSPVAMGVVERLAIFRIAAAFSGGHGSSMKSRWNGSHSLTMTDATAGEVLAWKSIPISMSGPRFSRIVSILF